MSTITQENLERIRKAAGKIDAVLPRRIWVEGSGEVFCDGPGNAQGRKLTALDLIRMIHEAKTENERIVVLA